MDWISVTQKEPMVEGEYLCFLTPHHLAGQYDVLPWTPDHGWSSTGWGEEHKVTHWMPLQPPRGDE